MITLATEQNPIRASLLPKLLECAASALLPRAGFESSSMDTGSLVHAGAHAFHTGKEGLAAIEAAREAFPLGDADKAKAHYLAYIADEKNRLAEVVRSEEEVYCRLPDPAGGEIIVIKGHLDQVRREADGRLTVHDIKTGGVVKGPRAVHHYAAQQAAYVVAATQTWGETHHPGSLICTDEYFVRLGKVHWSLDWSYEECLVILGGVVDLISAARRGRLSVNPREDVCHWCPHKPFPTCLQKVRGYK